MIRWQRNILGDKKPIPFVVPKFPVHQWESAYGSNIWDENGAMYTPNGITVTKLCETLDITLDELNRMVFKGYEDEYPNTKKITYSFLGSVIDHDNYSGSETDRISYKTEYGAPATANDGDRLFKINLAYDMKDTIADDEGTYWYPSVSYKGATAYISKSTFTNFYRNYLTPDYYIDYLEYNSEFGTWTSGKPLYPTTGGYAFQTSDGITPIQTSTSLYIYGRYRDADSTSVKVAQPAIQLIKMIPNEEGTNLGFVIPILVLSKGIYNSSTTDPTYDYQCVTICGVTIPTTTTSESGYFEGDEILYAHCNDSLPYAGSLPYFAYNDNDPDVDKGITNFGLYPKGWMPSTPVGPDIPGTEDPGTTGGPTTGTGDSSTEEVENGVSNYNVGKGISTNYAFTNVNLKDLGGLTWSTNILDQLNLLGKDPLNYIISIKSFPFSILSVLPSSEYASVSGVRLGNVNLDIEGTVYQLDNVATNRIGMGYLDIQEYYGSFLDYGSNTNLTLYLPYFGFIPLDTNIFMGHRLYVDYYVDLNSGVAVAEIGVYVGESKSPRLYQSFTISIDIPMTSTDASNRQISLATTLATTVIGMGATAATGGAAAPMMMGSALGALGSSAMNAMKENVNKGSILSDSSKWNMPQKPYVIFDIPESYESPSLIDVIGKKSDKILAGSACTGFTKCYNVVLAEMFSTDEERNMLVEELKKGIYK